MRRERTGVLVIRVWVERGVPSPLRARMTARSELACREQTVTVAAGVDAIVAAVREWLTTFVPTDPPE
jgi:hypothetical protein